MTNAHPDPHSRWLSRRGFSLVEVTLALGLVTFGLVSTLAVLPVGLSTLREAREAVAEANILQQIGAEFEATPFMDIPATKTLYFDQEGRRLNPGDPQRLYEVTTQATSPSYPGMPGQIVNRLKRIEIKIFRLDGDSGSGSSRPAMLASLSIPDSGQ